MFCPECGTKNEDGALFCGECGTSLKEYAEPPQQEEPQQEPVPQEEPQWEPVQQEEPQWGPARQEEPQWESPQQPQWEPSQPRQSKPVPKAVFAVVAEAILAVLLIFGISKVVGGMVSPESVAMKYWKAQMNCEWGMAYEYCDFPESDLLTKQMYVNVNKDKDEPVKYSSERILRAGSAQDSPSAKEYVIEYRKKGSSEKEYVYLTVAKTGKKKFLFLDEWKVTSSDNWCEDIQFQIPEGADVTLNGVKLQGKEEMEDSWKSVTVPYLFVGDYQMEVTGEGFEPYRKVINVSTYGCEDTYVELCFSEETVEELSKKAAEDIEGILESAFAGKGFSNVEKLFSKEAVNDGNAEADYEGLLELGNPDESDIVSLQLKNFVVTVNEENAPDYISVKITADMEKKYMDYWSESLEEDSGETEMYADYVKEDGEWKLHNMPVSYYDF